MSRSRLVPAAVCLFSFATFGCQSTYWQDRCHDAGEILDATLSLGPGVEISARVSEAAQLGGGAFHGHAFGWEEGRWASFREQRGEFGLSLLHFYEYRRDGGGELLDVHHPRWADPGFEEYTLSKDLVADRRRFDVGLCFHVAVLGVDLAFRPDELVDFFAGLIGKDPLNDDAHDVDRETLQRRARSLDAWDRARAFDAMLRLDGDDRGYAIYTVEGVRPPAQRRAIESLGTADADADAETDVSGLDQPR